MFGWSSGAGKEAMDCTVNRFVVGKLPGRAVLSEWSEAELFVYGMCVALLMAISIIGVMACV